MKIVRHAALKMNPKDQKLFLELQKVVKEMGMEMSTSTKTKRLTSKSRPIYKSY